MSIGGLDETMATCSENITRASSRINVRDVDIEMVQIVLKAQAEKKALPTEVNENESSPEVPESLAEEADQLLQVHNNNSSAKM